MNLVHEPDTTDLDAELRAALRRHADGLDLDQPDWQELIERPAPVVELPTGTAADGRAAERGTRHRARPSFVAAAVVAALLAGGLLVERTTSPGGEATPDAAPVSFTAPAPSDAEFDARTATAVWASGMEDPVAAAQVYLEGNGVVDVPAPATPARPELPTASLVDNDGTIAMVEWAGDTGVAAGTLILRNAAEDAAPSWNVVGATSDGIALEDIRYDGERLAFGVDDSTGLDGTLAVSAWSEGEPLPLDAPALDDVPQPPVDSEVVDPDVARLLPAGADVPDEPLTATLDEASTAVLRVQHLVDGRLVSVTEMAVALPGADAAAVAGAGAGRSGPDGAGARADIDSDVPASTDATVPSVDEGTPLEGDGVPLPEGVEVPDARDLPDGDDLPEATVPDVTVPGDGTAPTLPSGVPTVPTTVPAPGTTLPLP